MMSITVLQILQTVFIFGAGILEAGDMPTIVYTRPAGVVTICYDKPIFSARLNNVVGATGVVEIYGTVDGVAWHIVGTMHLSGANSVDNLIPKVDMSGYQQLKAVIPEGGITGTGAAITCSVGF